MKDIRFKDNETKVEFMLRTSAIIYDSSKTKILLFHPLKRDVYMLPGGKVRQLEKTKDAIEREIFEELGWKLEFEFVGISEEFLLDLEEKTQFINVIYKATYSEEIKEKSFYGKEGDWATFNWVNLNEDEYYTQDADKYFKAFVVHGLLCLFRSKQSISALRHRICRKQIDYFTNNQADEKSVFYVIITYQKGGLYGF